MSDKGVTSNQPLPTKDVSGLALVEMSASDAAAAVKAGQLKAAKLAEASIDQAVRLEQFGLFTSLKPELVMASAEAVDRRLAAGEDVGAFAGVPFVVKDNIDTKDIPTTGASTAFAGWQPESDAAIVSALRRAGGVLLGKTNMHELAIGITCNNPVYGPVRNPYDREMIPGGSSGGTAAAISARVAPAGLGTDTGGSVRIPAALCGCVGFRPTTGRYPADGIITLSWTRDTAGPMARTVEDAILLDSICAREPVSVLVIELAGRRIGVPRDYFADNLDPQLSEVFEAALDRLGNAGAILVEADMPDIRDHIANTGSMVLFEMPRALGAYLFEHQSMRSVTDVVSNVTGEFERGMLSRSLGSDAIDVQTYTTAAEIHRPAFVAAYAAYFKVNNLEAMLIPTTIMPARPIGQDETVQLNGKQVPTFPSFTQNCSPSSVTGQPGLSVPAGLTKNGLPVGIELVGPRGGDGAILALGRALEKILPAIPAPSI